MPTIARKVELYLVVSTSAKIDRSKAVQVIDRVFVRDLLKIMSSLGNQCELSDFDKHLLKDLPDLEWKIYTPEEFLNSVRPPSSEGK